MKRQPIFNAEHVENCVNTREYFFLADPPSEKSNARNWIKFYTSLAAKPTHRKFIIGEYIATRT